MVSGRVQSQFANGVKLYLGSHSIDSIHPKEAENAAKVKENFKGYSYFHTPEAVWELTSPRVLTMEWIDGCKISDVEKLKAMKISPQQVSFGVIRVTDPQGRQEIFRGDVPSDLL